MNHATEYNNMPNRSVISVHTKSEISQRLGELATLTHRSKSFLANEAIERYLKEEEAFIMSVQKGQADIAASRVYTTDEMRKHLKKFISKKTASTKDS
ncbi:MAG: ribbon-helix-helix domain-containing protein [gamma proteobacterium symbiont of Taylorina sp.]|nr:ribbon-helix-helix domain-containing protein [gamma proteobacterium symbiont of Taylorina sp.]